MIAKSVEPVFGDSSWMGFGFEFGYLDYWIIGLLLSILLHAQTVMHPAVAAQKGLRE